MSYYSYSSRLSALLKYLHLFVLVYTDPSLHLSLSLSLFFLFFFFCLSLFFYLFNFLFFFLLYSSCSSFYSSTSSSSSYSSFSETEKIWCQRYQNREMLKTQYGFMMFRFIARKLGYKTLEIFWVHIQLKMYSSSPLLWLQEMRWIFREYRRLHTNQGHKIVSGDLIYSLQRRADHVLIRYISLENV